MSSDKFYGNEKVREFIRNAIEGGTLSHALLVTGEKGLGKKTFARFLAKTLNCEKGSAFESCACTSCAKADRRNHPDIRWYGIDEEKTSVKIAEIKDLIHWIGLKPFEAKVKVFIVNDAHEMTLEAQNALLKTLEEPPPDSLLILLSDHRSLLLETLVSRSVEIKLAPLSLKSIIQILKDDYGIEKDAELAAQLSGGNLGGAIEMVQEGTLEENRRILADWIRKGSWDFFSQETAKTREEQRELMDLVLRFLRDVLIYQQAPGKERLFFPDQIAKIRELSEKHSHEEMMGLVKDLLALRESLEDNLNQKIVSAFVGNQLEEKLF